MMNRRTKTLLPTSKTALLPFAIDVNNTKHRITEKRIAAKSIYDRQTGPNHSKPEIGAYAYAKPPPNQRGKPWVYGKITGKDNASYTLETPRHTTLRRNRVHITPAAPPSKQLLIYKTIPAVLQSIPEAQAAPTSPREDTTPNPHQPMLQSNLDLPSVLTPASSPPIAPTSTRPKRTVKPPDRFRDYIMR